MTKFEALKAEIDAHPDLQEAIPQQRAVLATARLIYNWRRAANLSQSELAKAIGTKQAAISRLERGISRDGPKLSTLAAIAKACNQELVIGGRPAKEEEQRTSDEKTAWTVMMENPVPKREAIHSRSSSLESENDTFALLYDHCFKALQTCVSKELPKATFADYAYEEKPQDLLDLASLIEGSQDHFNVPTLLHSLDNEHRSDCDPTAYLLVLTSNDSDHGAHFGAVQSDKNEDFGIVVLCANKSTTRGFVDSISKTLVKNQRVVVRTDSSVALASKNPPFPYLKLTS